MTIKELGAKYSLVKEDVWFHKQSGQWILKHDAVEKIAHIENITLQDWVVEISEPDFVRYRITMNMLDDESGEIISETTIGEADKKNCMSNYYGMMAEKRGKDRCILKLIRAYQYGISSEVEADDFKNKKENE